MSNKSQSVSEKPLPEWVVRILRSCRQFGYIVLEPLDYVSRVINGKKDFPPLYLRRYVGPLRSFEMSGAEFMVYLRLIAELQPGEHVLDVGCGCGMMALYLKDYLAARARYVGVDIHQPSIGWCQRHISNKHPNFGFMHIDVMSRAYNPRGRHAAEAYSFPFEDHTFDVILLKSVFTHMRPPEVDAYLQQIARLLSNGGRCLMTFFLLNERQTELAREGRNTLQFGFGDETWRYVHQNSPESAAAYRESYVLDLLQKHGLQLSEPVMYGRWSGLNEGLSYQDMLLVKRQ